MNEHKNLNYGPNVFTVTEQLFFMIDSLDEDPLSKSRICTITQMVVKCINLLTHDIQPDSI